MPRFTRVGSFALPGILVTLVAAFASGCAGGQGLPGLAGATTGAVTPEAAQPQGAAATSVVNASVDSSAKSPTPASAPADGAGAGYGAGGASLIPAALTSLPAAFAKSDRLISNTPTETYALVARGATRCWFGRGPLAQSHIFHADAEPESKGGRASIAVHERDRSADNPRGIKAYRIDIVPSPTGGAVVEQENLKLPSAAGEAMRRDVARWANGDLACGAMEALHAAAAPMAPPAPASPAAVSKQGKKVAKGKSQSAAKR